MSRHPTEDPDGLVTIRAAFAQATESWQRARLFVVELALQGTLMAGEVAVAHGVSRRTVFNWVQIFYRGGVSALLARGRTSGRRAVLQGTRQREFEAKVRRGTFSSTRDAQEWIRRRTGKSISLFGVRKLIARCQGKSPSEGPTLKPSRRRGVRPGAGPS
jgi:transposase